MHERIGRIGQALGFMACPRAGWLASLWFTVVLVVGAVLTASPAGAACVVGLKQMPPRMYTVLAGDSAASLAWRMLGHSNCESSIARWLIYSKARLAPGASFRVRPVHMTVRAEEGDSWGSVAAQFRGLTGPGAAAWLAAFNGAQAGSSLEVGRAVEVPPALDGQLPDDGAASGRGRMGVVGAGEGSTLSSVTLLPAAREHPATPAAVAPIAMESRSSVLGAVVIADGAVSLTGEDAARAAQHDVEDAILRDTSPRLARVIWPDARYKEDEVQKRAADRLELAARVEVPRGEARSITVVSPLGTYDAVAAVGAPGTVAAVTERTPAAKSSVPQGDWWIELDTPPAEVAGTGATGKQADGAHGEQRSSNRSAPPVPGSLGRAARAEASGVQGGALGEYRDPARPPRASILPTPLMAHANRALDRRAASERRPTLDDLLYALPAPAADVAWPNREASPVLPAQIAASRERIKRLRASITQAVVVPNVCAHTELYRRASAAVVAPPPPVVLTPVHAETTTSTISSVTGNTAIHMYAPQAVEARRGGTVAQRVGRWFAGGERQPPGPVNGAASAAAGPDPAIGVTGATPAVAPATSATARGISSAISPAAIREAVPPAAPSIAPAMTPAMPPPLNPAGMAPLPVRRPIAAPDRRVAVSASGAAAAARALAATPVRYPVPAVHRDTMTSSIAAAAGRASVPPVKPAPAAATTSHIQPRMGAVSLERRAARKLRQQVDDLSYLVSLLPSARHHPGERMSAELAHKSVGMGRPEVGGGAAAQQWAIEALKREPLRPATHRIEPEQEYPVYTNYVPPAGAM